ncbi:MAG: hypothetical protein JSV19_08275 [Phycisphaerales bacterium]|nr:MAG: hypothetical protein JSV19_08275 [Phycisphaerales bacterium]
MRHTTLIRLMSLAIGMLVVTATAGCTRKIINENLRVSIGTFVTGVVTSAVDASLEDG